MHDIIGTPYKDVKLKQLISPNEFQMIQINECFSIYDQAWKKGVEGFLMEKFQQKSKWEL